MVETFTPAVCGSRNGQRVALLGFALGAIGTSALVGAALGALGMVLGLELALVVAGLALLAAAREAGLVRFPLPQVRRQVPERWRATLPLPVWSLGYGAGLGAGFFTFQPVSTFWVACAGAVALGRPAAAAVCFAAYGAGRTLMTMAPRRGRDATSAVEALVRRRRTLLAVNVGALLVCAALLSAPAAAAPTNVGPGFDPAATGSALARGQMGAGDTKVILEPDAGGMVEIPGGAAPAIDGDLLAYADDQGIKVIDWTSQTLVARIDGAVSKPALDWPRLAFIRRSSDYERLILADFTDVNAPTERRIASVRVRDELGRPALRSGRLAWHKLTRRNSRVVLMRLSTGNKRAIVHSDVNVLTNPALTATRILWVDQGSRRASLFVRRLGSGGARAIYRITGRDRRMLTTAIAGRTAYVTRWAPNSGASTLVRVIF